MIDPQIEKKHTPPHLYYSYDVFVVARFFSLEYFKILISLSLFTLKNYKIVTTKKFFPLRLLKMPCSTYVVLQIRVKNLKFLVKTFKFLIIKKNYY